MSQKCTKCEIDKPLSEFYIRNETGKYRKDCKECMNKRKLELRKKYIENNNEKLKNVDKTQIKTCSVCKIEKQLNEFSISTGNKTGFYSWCLICSRKKDNDRNKIRKVYIETDI